MGSSQAEGKFIMGKKQICLKLKQLREQEERQI